MTSTVKKVESFETRTPKEIMREILNNTKKVIQQHVVMKCKCQE